MQFYPKYCRRTTSTTRVGDLLLGSDYPIRIQTMANTSTDDVEASTQQAVRCAEAGAELFRFTTQGIREVESLAQIRQRLTACGNTIPLVADVHFRSDVADAAALVADKVRINPGNYAPTPEAIRERFTHLLALCREHHTAIRIGVNHGSLSPRILQQYGDTPEGMVASCMEFLRIAVEENFRDIVLSVKASDTHIMVQTVRLLVAKMDEEDMHFPLHLGVTEAGEGEDGRIKSAVGIGALLADGIGDTVRVSLSEAPEAELPVARELVRFFTAPDSLRYTANQAAIEGDTLIYTCAEEDASLMSLHAAAECGHLLWDNKLKELIIKPVCPALQPYAEALAKDILQAAGLRRYKTEFVSCPGCGRTMFDLQNTVATIKQAFQRPTAKDQQPTAKDQRPLKIAIMGCIVNGPGEMADADYGYVGAGRDRISLYRGKECVLKNIPQEQAVDSLIRLIRQDQSTANPDQPEKKLGTNI